MVCSLTYKEADSNLMQEEEEGEYFCKLSKQVF